MSFHGLQLAFRTFPGAKAFRVVHPTSQRIAEHQHELLCLDLHVIGSYTELYDGGQAWIGSPSVVLHPPGEPHANSIDERGLETIGIQVDLDWLRCSGFDKRLTGTRCWIGGRVAAAAHWLVAVWSDPQYSEFKVAQATTHFLSFALQSTADTPPAWLNAISRALDVETPLSTADLARALNLHPAWLARAYRAAVGEGIHETLRRKRIERAVDMLRSSNYLLARVAVDAGFCDQSHMNRVFRAIMGRTPLQVRAEQELLGAYNAPRQTCSPQSTTSCALSS
jgi:AraC family transcriptional regulator